VARLRQCVSKVKPYALSYTQNCQLIHTFLPTKEVSIGRAQVECGEGGMPDVLGYEPGC
jgi:hypothetical protein